ncbi:MAG: septal ring lytic transglycosylase RlpA family protein [Deltaproteobacteria bacterium]|nr:septal ring lytic transglycosylase RlpA family protein [Deltaproteobacteria bacterium]
MAGMGGSIGPATYRTTGVTARLGVWLMPVLLWLAACGTTRQHGPPSDRSANIDDRQFAPAPGLRQTGIASYYANSLAGNATASGERYRPQKLTAAHRTLPFGTWVRVVRIDNAGHAMGPSVKVRINDRGPYSRSRILDVSMAAAKILGMLGPGVVRVELLVVPAPPGG